MTNPRLYFFSLVECVCISFCEDKMEDTTLVSTQEAQTPYTNQNLNHFASQAAMDNATNILLQEISKGRDASKETVRLCLELGASVNVCVGEVRSD